ncbi:hypothetical protein WMY93_012886 [Mugilogobius chulae]|uniref:Secreted protein n=1 Tax=Mugilogobius chulae TaxID=88201 RepID=A0AAW0P7M5_9GOBI
MHCPRALVARALVLMTGPHALVLAALEPDRPGLDLVLDLGLDLEFRSGLWLDAGSARGLWVQAERAHRDHVIRKLSHQPQAQSRTRVRTRTHQQPDQEQDLSLTSAACGEILYNKLEPNE